MIEIAKLDKDFSAKIANVLANIHTSERQHEHERNMNRESRTDNK